MITRRRVIWRSQFSRDRTPGHRCDKEKWDAMLDRLYELYGWDKATGLPTRQGLTELGLEDIVERLAAAEKLK